MKPKAMAGLTAALPVTSRGVAVGHVQAHEASKGGVTVVAGPSIGRDDVCFGAGEEPAVTFCDSCRTFCELGHAQSAFECV